MWQYSIWRTLKFFVEPTWGSKCVELRKYGTWKRSRLPALKGGKRGVLEVPGLDYEERQLCCYMILHPKPTPSWLKLILHPKPTPSWLEFILHPKPTPSWLELILHPFDVGTNHGRPWTHLTHHGPDSGEATTFPHIVFSALLRGSHIRMALFPETPKEESRNCLGLNS